MPQMTTLPLTQNIPNGTLPKYAMPLHSNKIPKHIRESLIIPDKAHFYHKMIIIK